MIATNWITRTPKINLFSILIALFLFAIGISNFKLDASSETLLLAVSYTHLRAHET